MKKLFLISLSILFVALVGCEKERLEEAASSSQNQEKRMDYDIANDEIDHIRSKFAMVLHEAVKKAEIRSFLQKEFYREYKEDYEPLYLVLKDKKVDGRNTFSEYLAEVAGDEFLRDEGAVFFSNIVPEVDPMLTISMPDSEEMNAKIWDISIIPDIVAVTKNASQEGAPGITFDGKNKIFPAEHKVERPIVFLKRAEFTIVFNKNTLKTIEGRDLKDYIPDVRGGDGNGDPGPDDLCEELISAIFSVSTALQSDPDNEYLITTYNTLIVEYYRLCVSIGDPTNDVPCEEECERDCVKADEVMHKFRINGWDAFKVFNGPIWENRYTFHCTIGLPAGVDPNTGALHPGGTAQFVSPSYRKRNLLDCSSRPCQGKWKVHDYRVYADWPREILGEFLTYTWHEVDEIHATASFGLTYGVQVSIPEVGTVSGNLTANININPSQEVALGNQRVFYCDGADKPGTEYDTGVISFVVYHDN